jgi:hypothetical protein
VIHCVHRGEKVLILIEAAIIHSCGKFWFSTVRFLDFSVSLCLRRRYFSEFFGQNLTMRAIIVFGSLRPALQHRMS